MSMEIVPNDPVTLAGSVYLRLRDDIVSGELKAGSHLRLHALRARYGVGMSPIREALSKLAQDTFVTASENRGYRVAELSREDLEDIIDTRVLVECDALRRSIAQGDESWEATIVGTHYRLSKLDQRLADSTVNILDEWELANRAFHDALVSACNSHWLQRFRRLLQDQSKRYRRFSVARTATYRAVHSEHTALMEATLARKADDAVFLIEQHIRETANSLLNRMAADGVQA